MPVCITESALLILCEQDFIYHIAAADARLVCDRLSSLQIVAKAKDSIHAQSEALNSGRISNLIPDYLISSLENVMLVRLAG